MDLHKQEVDVILDIIDTALLIGVQDIGFKRDGVGGIDPNRTAVLYSPTPLDILGEYELAINRPSLLITRLGLCLSDPSFVLKCEIDDRNNAISKLTAKSKKTKIDYRCANPDRIEMPTKINNIPTMTFNYDPDIVNLLQKSQHAMHTDLITIGIDGDGMGFYQFQDLNNDECSGELDIVYNSEDSVGPLSFRYSAKMLFNIMKKSVKIDRRIMSIGNRGLLQVDFDNISAYITPRHKND